MSQRKLMAVTIAAAVSLNCVALETPTIVLDANIWADADSQPHVSGKVINNTSHTFATLRFSCEERMSDRVQPIFTGSFSFDLKKVIAPGEKQKIDIVPNMFSPFGNAILDSMPGAKWYCSAIEGIDAGGNTIALSITPTNNADRSEGMGPAKFGASFVEVPKNIASMNHIEWGKGVWIVLIAPNLPAEKAGIAQGDILLSFDGVEINSPGALQSAVRDHKSGSPAQVVIVTQGKQRSVVVNL